MPFTLVQLHIIRNAVATMTVTGRMDELKKLVPEIDKIQEEIENEIKALEEPNDTQDDAS